MSSNRPIGIFDSGVGGLTVLAEIKKLLPNEPVIYFADQKNLPYSEKSGRELKKITSQILEFLIKKKVKAIIIACNTGTVFTLSYLRSKFNLPIIGIVPVVKTASEKTKNGRIGILSTVATSKSNYQNKLIKRFADGLKVINIGTDKLVPFVEGGLVEGKTVSKVLQQVIKPFCEADIDILALGCSHYPFLRSEIQTILGSKILVLDSGAAVARQVKRVLENNSSLASLKNPECRFFTSGDPEKFKKVAEKLLRKSLSQTFRAAYN